jgi:hypothetical protein
MISNSLTPSDERVGDQTHDNTHTYDHINHKNDYHHHTDNECLPYDVLSLTTPNGTSKTSKECTREVYTDNNNGGISVSESSILQSSMITPLTDDYPFAGTTSSSSTTTMSMTPSPSAGKLEELFHCIICC